MNKASGAFGTARQTTLCDVVLLGFGKCWVTVVLRGWEGFEILKKHAQVSESSQAQQDASLWP